MEVEVKTNRESLFVMLNGDSETWLSTDFTITSHSYFLRLSYAISLGSVSSSEELNTLIPTSQNYSKDGFTVLKTLNKR